MKRVHYRRMAQVLHTHYNVAVSDAQRKTVELIAKSLSDYFIEENSHFKRSTFMNAVMYGNDGTNNPVRNPQQINLDAVDYCSGVRQEEAEIYTTVNYRTKKALKDAVKNGEQVTVYQPGGIFDAPRNGIAYLEGPHYPQPHTWYARVMLKDGVIQKVLS